MKKKTKAKKNEPQTARTSAALASDESNKRRIDDGTKEFMGIHVIGEQDTERHFGSDEVKTGDAAQSRAAAKRAKADVHLQLDGEIWQAAEREAARLGLAMSEYIELALNDFKNRPAK